MKPSHLGSLLPFFPLLFACGGPAYPQVEVAGDVDLVAVDYPITLYTSWFRRGSKASLGRTDPHDTRIRCAGNTCDVAMETVTIDGYDRTKVTVRPEEVRPFEIIVTLENLDTGEIHEETVASEAVIPNGLELSVGVVVDGTVYQQQAGETIELPAGVDEVEGLVTIHATYDTRPLSFTSSMSVNGVALDPQLCWFGYSTNRCQITVRAGTLNASAEVAGRSVDIQHEVR